MLTSCTSPNLQVSPTYRASSYASPRPSSTTSSPRTYSKNSLVHSPKHFPPSSTSTVLSSVIPASPSSKSITIDVGTQYTPPDWPPTSSRATRAVSTNYIKSETTDTPELERNSSITRPHNVATATPPAPPEPQLRVTPQASLQQIGTAFRRSHSSVSNSYADQSSSSLRSSPLKRARQQNEQVKVVPIDYSTCDTKDLAVLIADMLMELIRFNDEISLKDGHLTRFHSRAPPGISVHDYLKRLTHHATLLPAILLSMVYLIDQLCHYYPVFTINSLTVHRFLITSATVASKGLSDSFWTNNTYAKVGGVTVKELALLELELLQRIDWQIITTPENLVGYYRKLVGRNEDYVIADETMDTSEHEVSPPGTNESSKVTDTNQKRDHTLAKATRFAP